jgi:WD40 repeat protein
MLSISVRTVTALGCALVMLPRDAGAVEVRQVTRSVPFEVGELNISGYNTPVWARDGQSLVAAAHGAWDFGPCPVPCYELVQALVAFDLDGNGADSPFWQDRGASRPSPNPMQQGQFAFSCYAHLLCTGVCVEDLADHSTFACLQGQNPAWSPDGQTIVTETYFGLQSFSPSGGAGRPLTTRGDDTTPAWSPDGEAIVYSSTQGGTRDLWILDVTSGATRRLMADSALDTWPAWSPDGRWIAFASDRDGSSRIWAIPSAGGNPIRVVDGPSGSAPAWSPDGGSLAFESDGHIWIATGVRDVLVAVESQSWSKVKALYGNGSR